MELEGKEIILNKFLIVYLQQVAFISANLIVIMTFDLMETTSIHKEIQKWPPKQFKLLVSCGFYFQERMFRKNKKQPWRIPIRIF